MPSYLVPLRSVIKLFMILLYLMRIQSAPLNGKLNPVLGNEDTKAKPIGSIFAKIPQELKPENTRELLSKGVLPHDTHLGIGSTNQIAKIQLPALSPIDDSQLRESKNFINIPIVTQPYGDYNVIVATAPKNIRIGKGENEKPVVIYVVFPDDNGDPKSLNIPSIYFITKPDTPLPFQKKKEDPIFVIDSNRTVTGLKSKAMTKFVKFKNKMTSLFEFN